MNFTLLLHLVATNGFAQENVAPPPIPISMINQLTQELATLSVKDIHFPVGSDIVSHDSANELKELGVKLNALEGLYLLIEAYTDGTGSSERNLALSTARANAVAKIVQENGDLHPKQFITIGHGDRYATASDQEGKARERRVSIKLLTRRNKPDDIPRITGQLRVRGVPIDSWAGPEQIELDGQAQSDTPTSQNNNRTYKNFFSLSVGPSASLSHWQEISFGSTSTLSVSYAHQMREYVVVATDASVLQGRLNYQGETLSYRSLGATIGLGRISRWSYNIHAFHTIKLGYQSYEIFSKFVEGPESVSSAPDIEGVWSIGIENQLNIPIPGSRYSAYSNLLIRTNPYHLEAVMTLGIGLNFK